QSPRRTDWRAVFVGHPLRKCRRFGTNTLPCCKLWRILAERRNSVIFSPGLRLVHLRKLTQPRTVQFQPKTAASTKRFAGKCQSRSKQSACVSVRTHKLQFSE